MPLINLKLLVGRAAGRRATFDQTVITFGRSEDSLYVIPETFVSRHHGEIRYENNRWLLHNLSSGGTRVNRRKVTKKPHPLKDGDTIAIGDRPVFQTHFEPAVATADQIAEVDADSSRSTAPARLSGRAKLWIGIGVYLTILLVLVIVLNGVISRDDVTPVARRAEFTPEQIEREITSPAPPRQPDPVRSEQALQKARRLFRQRDMAKANLYNAYLAYQDALAWSGKDHFEEPNDDDNLWMYEVRKDLVVQVTRRYQDAYAKLQSGQFREADQAFGELTTIYPDHDGALYNAIEHHRRTAQRKHQERRRSAGTGLRPR